MGILKKLKKKDKAGLMIKKTTSLFIAVDDLKSNSLLETTDRGVFYVFPEVLESGHNPRALCRNLYIYGRSTGLIQIDQVLYIRDMENSRLLAKIYGSTVELFI